jgi:sulfate permease, SulP family
MPSPRVPIADWIRTYGRADLGRDAAAGLTTAVMLVPQAMAYAMLAGLPPIVGLYASVVPLVLYAIFGTSRQLAVGPVAMDSLLVAASVGAIATTGSVEYVAYAALLAAMVGVVQLGMGVLRLGFVVDFLSLPVISGFTSAAAIIIGASQLPHLLGLSMPRSSHVRDILASALAGLGGLNPITLAIGLGSMALLVALARLAPRLPRALVVVALGSLAVWLLGLHERGVAIVGQVPSGLPAPALPVWDPGAMRALVPAAFIIALVAFMEAISVAKAFARRNRYEIDANQELIGLGAANVGAALFRAYPVTGGFSRTAVNAQAGARTQMAAIITAAIVALTLLLFTPLFHYLPKAVLAAIIMTAVLGLIDVAEVRRLYRVSRPDLGLLLITFTATLTLGIQMGIAVGIAASLAWFVFQANRPHVAVLGRLPGTTVYRNVKRFPEAETFAGTLILRVDAPVFFGNVAFLKQTLSRLEHDRAEPLRTIIIDAAGMGNMDASAIDVLHEIVDEHQSRGQTLFFAGVTGPVRDLMERSGFRDHLGADHFFRTVEEAVDARAGTAERDGAVTAGPEPDRDARGRGGSAGGGHLGGRRGSRDGATHRRRSGRDARCTPGNR